MCGRYTLRATTEDLIRRFGVKLTLFEVSARYNVAPAQTVPAIFSDGQRRLEGLRWGLIPFWTKDLKKTKPMINARMETVAEKPTFKTALTRRRCLIPADGFFEWMTRDNQRVPVHIHLPDHKLFSFAGLWDQWSPPEGEPVKTCTIITIPAAGWLTEIHDRMPAILTPDDEASWLDPELKDPARLLSLLKPDPERPLERFEVSRKVNSPAFDRPECVEPIEAGA